MKQKKKVLFLRGIGTLGITCFLMCASVYADAPDNIIISVQRNYPELFKQNSIIFDAVRFLLWKLVLLLQMITRLCVSLYDHSLGFMTSISTDINEYVPYAHELFTAILAVSLLVMGIIFIVYPKKKPELLVSLFLIVVTLSLQTVILNPMIGPTKEAVKEIALTRDITSKVVSNHIYDLVYIDSKLQNGLADLASGTIPLKDLTLNLTKEQLDLISINDTINYENERLSESAKGKNGILGKKAKFYYQGDGSEEVVLKDVYNGFGWNSDDQADFMNQFYYRYKVDTLEIVLVLLALMIVYVFMSYKVIRIVIEIIMGNILAIFYSANFNSVQKTVQILKEILNAFLVLLLSAVLIRVFYIAEETLNRMNLNGVVYGFLLLFLAFAIIDGPNIIQRIVGVDAGLSNELGKLFAIYQMAQLGGAVAHTAGATIGAVGGMAAKGAKKIGSAMERDAKASIPPELGSVQEASTGFSGHHEENSAMESENRAQNVSDERKESDWSQGMETNYEETGQEHSIGDQHTEDSGILQDAEKGIQEGTLSSESELLQNDSFKTPNGEAIPEKGNENLDRRNGSSDGKKDTAPSVIGKEAPIVDLSRNKSKTNEELANEMNQKYDEIQKIGERDVTGFSGLSSANATSLEVDWEFLTKNREEGNDV